MESKEKKVLIPGNLITFKCEMCGECCGNWTIHIDKKTYELLEKANDLKDVLKKLVILPKGSIDKYAYIKLDSDGKCPFIENTSCTIQERKGLDYLSDVCRIYPRFMIKTDRGMEVSSYFSCKAALKKLDRKEPVEFYMDPLGYTCYKANNVITAQAGKTRDTNTNYYELEELLIDIMQFRQYSISERLLLTGSFLDSFNSGNENEKHDLINGFRHFLGRRINDIYGPLSADKLDLVKLFNKLGKSVVHMDYCPEKFNNYFSELIEKFDKIDKEFFKDFEYDYILENFFVMYIFRKNFLSKNTLAKEYYYMVINFLFILLHMNLTESSSKEALLESINISEKLFNHNLSFKKSLLEDKTDKDLILNGLKLCTFYSVGKSR